MSITEDTIVKSVGEEQNNDHSYNLQAPIFKDDSTIGYREYILRPEGVGDVSTRFNEPNTTIEFNYIPKGDIYNPSRIKFVMEVLVKMSANNIVADRINICSDITQVFQRGNMRIGSSPPEEIDRIGMANYILKLVGTSEDFAKSSGSLMGFYPNIYKTESLTAGTTIDENAARRQARACVPGAQCITRYEFTLPFALFNSKKYLSNVGWTLTLQRANNNCLFLKASTAGEANNYPTLTINKLYMIIPVVTPNMKIKIEYDRQAKQLFTLQTKRIQTVFKSINPGTDFNETIANLPARPSKIYIAFQDPAAENAFDGAGAVHADPSVFSHANVTNINLVLNNSENVPELIPNCDFTSAANLNYAEQLGQLLECSGAMNNVDAGSIINYENYKSMYPIFGFNTSRNPQDIPELSNTPCKVDLRMRCSAAPGARNMFMVCVYDTILSILGDSSVSKTLMG